MWGNGNTLKGIGMRSNAMKFCLLPAAMLSQLMLPALSMAAPAEPETAPSAGLEEIVVTATRRSERLQDIPVSVIAFSQEKMDQQGLRNIDDLSRLSPGLNFQRNGMSSAGNYNDAGSDINIRGVDSTAGT
jgi:outer membrane receptor protein involved in Fe transport